MNNIPICRLLDARRHGIAVSMTEDYNPTDNAVAERVNGIVKQEAVHRRRAFSDMAEARHAIGRYISFYNSRRPHMSIGDKTPDVVHLQEGEQKNMWKRRKNDNDGNRNGEKGYLCRV